MILKTKIVLKNLKNSKVIMTATNAELITKINKLKKEKNAIILAHFYQTGDIQDIADYIGDSLGLSQNAASTNADIILFAGVNFMAETAKIINPNKKVIVPDINAGCSLADTCKIEEFKDFINKHPNHKVVSYINCSAEVKTVSDIICTSSNAVKIINSLPIDEKIIFAPDRNLGNYVNNITGRNMVLWNGSCEVHDILSLERVITLKTENHKAKLIAHPECKAVILEIADYIGSTTALLNYTINDNAQEYIVATETGIIHQMQKSSPHKKFIVATAESNCACNDCPYMKLNTLEKLYNCLLNETPEIKLPQEIIQKAKQPIVKMLEISQ